MQVVSEKLQLEHSGSEQQWAGDVETWLPFYQVQVKEKV